MTESGRCFGLAFLSAGKYFLVNNGPYFGNYDFPPAAGRNPNIFFFPGPARGWICRTPLSFDEWIPSVLFLTHYLPDDPGEDQMVSIGSLVLGQNGIWGDLPAISPEGVARFGTILNSYKQVRDDITRAYPVRSGPVGGSPEVHEKIAAKGRGVVVIFGRHGSYRYITSQPVDRHLWHDADTKVSFDDKGRAIIDVTIPLPPKDPKAGWNPKTPSGARLVFFGVDKDDNK